MALVHSLPAVSVPTEQEAALSYKLSTNAATLCGEIVKATARNIQGKKYVQVEGWLSIAAAHGCLVSIREVENVDGGVRAIAELRRMSDQALLATAEGFVGDDEPMWAKRPVYARRAMAQTRASSRVCRSAFAHVVVLIDKSLGTTPAEEVPDTGFGSNPRDYVDEAVQDGLVKNGDTRSTHEQTYVPVGKRPENIERTQKKVDTAISTFKLSGQSPESLDEFWKSQAKDFNWIKQHIPDEYKRLEEAFLDARDAAEARITNTLRAG